MEPAGQGKHNLDEYAIAAKIASVVVGLLSMCAAGDENFVTGNEYMLPLFLILGLSPT